jgi:hypothetical protein
MAGLLTLLGGVILLVAANAIVGICIILLSALYFALAEIISYLAIIARQAQGEQSFAEEFEEVASDE